MHEDIDYADFTPVEASDAEEAYQNAVDFIQKIKEILPSLIAKLK